MANSRETDERSFAVMMLDFYREREKGENGFWRR